MAGKNVQNNADNNTGGITGKGWKPGQSGNPGGRPKSELSAAIVARKVAEAKCEINGKDGKPRYAGMSKLEALFARLWERAMAKGDVQAARLLLEYGYGKPAQTVDLKSTAPFKIQIVVGDDDTGSGDTDS